ncbi:MAG: beta-ketoacyl-ACP synthase 3, partial [Alcaligenes sp.]
MTIFAKIIGTGGYLPPRVVSNDDLAAELAQKGIETSDEWIVERTGIRQRHLADPGVRTSQLATHAARQALEDAGVQAQDLDLIVVATSTPDYVFPSTACLVQAELGNKGAAAYDVQAVCSGFVYALTTAEAMIRAGRARHALVIGAEVFSGILDWNDRSTCVLFGDGAGAGV